MLICIGYHYNPLCDDIRFLVFDSDDYTSEWVSDEDAYSILRKGIEIKQLEINTEYKKEYKCKCYSDILRIFSNGDRGLGSYQYQVYKIGNWYLIDKCDDLNNFVHVCHKYKYYGLARGLLVLEPYYWWNQQPKHDNIKYSVYLRDVSNTLYLAIDNNDKLISYFDETTNNRSLSNSATGIFDMSSVSDTIPDKGASWVHRTTGDVYYWNDNGIFYDSEMTPTLYTFGNKVDYINTHIKSRLAVSDITRTDIIKRLTERFDWLTVDMSLDYKVGAKLQEDIYICKANIIQAVLNNEFQAEFYTIGKQLGIIDFGCSVKVEVSNYAIPENFVLQFRGRFTKYPSSFAFQGFMPLDILGEIKVSYYQREEK